MPELLQQPENIVYLVGKIVNIYKHSQSTTVTLRIPMRGPRGKFQVAFPEAYCMHGDNTGIDSFFIDDNVRITGHLVNTPKRRTNGAQYYSQAIIVDKIEENKPILESEFNIPGMNSEKTQPVSLVYLHGEIEQVTQTAPGVLSIRMNARNNGHDNHVVLTAFNQAYLLLAPGHVVSVTGRVETKRKVQETGAKRYYQNFIVQKIVDETEHPEKAQSILAAAPSNNTAPAKPKKKKKIAIVNNVDAPVETANEASSAPTPKKTKKPASAAEQVSKKMIANTKPVSATASTESGLSALFS